MGISAFGASGIKPGVCLSTTRPSAPYEGQMIYETDTNRVLIWDNAAWVMIADTDSPPGLELVKAQAVGNSVTSVVVTNAFSSTYSNYRVIWSGATMTSSSGDSQMTIQLGPSSVSGYNTGYYSVLVYANGTSVLTANQSNGGQMNWVGGGSTGSGVMTVEVFNPYDAVYTRFNSSGYNAWNDTYLGWVSGVHRSSNQFTDFTINITGTGNASGGTVRVYGYRN